MNPHSSPPRSTRNLRFWIVPFLLLSVLLTGCESLPATVRGSRDLPPLTRDFDVPAQAVLAAAPHALERIGFKITRLSASQGLVEALSDIRRDPGMRNSKQIRMKMTVEDFSGGVSRASLQLWEMREEENARGERFASETGIGSIALHDSVFGAIEHVLKAPTE